MKEYKYILVDRKPVVERDVLKWAEWFEKNRVIKVAQTDTPVKDPKWKEQRAKVTVSTVFLGIDHNFFESATTDYKPLVFETMIFGGPLDGYQDRTSTWQDAEAAHKVALDLVKLANKKQLGILP